MLCYVKQAFFVKKITIKVLTWELVREKLKLMFKKYN